MTPSRPRLVSLIAALALVAIGLASLAAPATADDEKRRVVKKIKVGCEGEDCVERRDLEQVLDGVHVWSSPVGPHHFRFRTHVGGGFLGVRLAELTPELRVHFGVAEDAGVMISRVLGDSAAQAAGLSVGDIVTRVDGREIASTSDLGRAIRRQ